MSEDKKREITPPKKMYFKPPENLSTVSKEEREAFVEDIVNHLFRKKKQGNN
jgi:hypothetical protein